MKEFQETASKSSDLELDINSVQDWSSVEAFMRKAEVQFSERHRDKKIKASIARFVQRVGANGGVFQAWLSLLPSTEYTSVVCSAFQLCIKTVMRMEEVRDDVMSALAQIPEALQTAKQYLEIHDLETSIQLQVAFARLYKCILDVFQHILAWMSSKTKRWTRAILQQSDYGKDLEDLVKLVYDQAGVVRQQAEICSQHMIRDIRQNEGMQTVRLGAIQVDLVGLRSEVIGIGETANDNSRMLNDNSYMLNTFLTLVKGMAKDHKTIQVTSPKVPQLSNNQVLKTLDCTHDSKKDDVPRALAAGLASNSEYQEKAQMTVGHKRLETWILNEEQQILLINGGGRSENISPLTFAVGLLAKSLESFQNAISLVFMCGMRLKDGSDDRCAEFMIANLISQLLRSDAKLDLDFIRTHYRKKDLATHDLETLCTIFRELVLQLPKDQVIFIMIDGINAYEYGDRKQSTLQAMDMLTELEEEADCVYKLLVTSPARSIAVCKLFDREDILNLKSGFASKSQSRMSARKLIDRKSRAMREVSRQRQKDLHPANDWLEGSDSEESDSEESDSGLNSE